MNLQIRDPRAHALAKRIAEHRHLSLTEAVIAALEAEVRRLPERPLADRLMVIADDLAALSGSSRGPNMSRDDVAAMWGHG